MYSCHLFLISSASVRSIPFLSINWVHLGINIPLVSLIFLKRSLVFPFLLFFSISLHWSLRKAFLSLLATLWNCVFKRVYLSLSPLRFASPLFTAICKTSSDNHFPFLHFFFSWGWSWFLSPVQCYEPLSIVHQTLCLIRSSPLNLFLTYTVLLHCIIIKGFDLGHTWMV